MSDAQRFPLGAWPGGTVADLAVCGELVLAATFAGLFRSVDDGRTWQPVGRNLPDWFVQAVAVAPAGGRIVALAASHQGWLYSSWDGGQTWEAGSDWLDLGLITRLVASPCFEQDGIVLACTEEDGIYKSSDRGRSWKHASFGLLNRNVAALCFSPNFAQDQVIFAGTDGGGLFRSRNAGRAWRESGEGLPDSAVQCLAISPAFAADGTIWAGTEDRGLYRSTDGGHTWAACGAALDQACINGLYVPPGWDGGRCLVAATDLGLCISADGGHSWEPAQGGPAFPYTVIGGGDGLLAGAYGDGVYRSAEGLSWQPSNACLVAHVPPLACFSGDFERDQTLWMASMEGILVRSTDAGQTWQALQEDEFEISSLSGARAGGSTLLLAMVEGGLLASRDGGETWAILLDAHEDPPSAAALSQTYDRDRTILAGTSGGRIMCSDDGGVGWEQVAFWDGETIVALAGRTAHGALSVYAVTARQIAEDAWHLSLRDAGSGQVLLAGQAGSPVSHLCLDAGGWLLCSIGTRVTVLAEGAPAAVVELAGDTLISCLCAGEGAMLIGTRQGVYRSTDGGQTWPCVAADVGALALHVASPARLYGASIGGQVWRLDLPAAL